MSLRCPACSGLDEDGDAVNVIVEVPFPFIFTAGAEQGDPVEDAIYLGDLQPLYVATCGGCAHRGTVANFSAVAAEVDRLTGRHEETTA